jgi:shikimate kinase
VYLVGMMGSGKSTVAGALAGALGYTPVDVDSLIEGATGRPVRAIFEAEGEETFRELETETLRQILPLARTVVATGGGAVLRRENWGLMRQAVVVHLDPPVEVLAARLGVQQDGPAGERPLLAGDDTFAELGRIAEERAQFYAEADVRVEVAADMEAEAVADAVCREVSRKMKAKKEEEEDRKNFTIEYDGEPPRQDGKQGYGSPQ